MRIALLMLLLAGCERPNPLRLEAVILGDDAKLGGGPAGFSCRNPCICPGGGACDCLLFQRASDHARQGANPAFGGASAMGSAIVDLMSIGPGPSDTNPFVVISRCTENPCKPILRRCLPLDLTAIRDAVDRDGAAAKGSLLNTIFSQLHASGASVTDDAPDAEVVVRMVTTTLSCDQMATLPLRFSEWPLAANTRTLGQSIFGCGYAGPLLLDKAHEVVVVGLPTLDAVSCVPQAAVCANDLDPRGGGTLFGF